MGKKVSNSNGVNFNVIVVKSRYWFIMVSNSNGVNFNKKARLYKKEKQRVSNSNGVNFNNEKIKAQREYMLFQTPTE